MVLKTQAMPMARHNAKATRSVEAERVASMLVEALPQSPQNTESVFWKRWKVPAATRFCKSLNGHQRPSFSDSLATVREKLAAAVSRIATNINHVCRRINSTGHFYDADVAELKERMADVWELLKVQQRNEL